MQPRKPMLHMKRLPIFMTLCVLCFQRQSFLTFIIFYSPQSVAVETEKKRNLQYTSTINTGLAVMSSSMNFHDFGCEKDNGQTQLSG